MYQSLKIVLLTLGLAACSQKPAQIVMHEPSAPKIIRPPVPENAPFKPVFGDIRQSQPAPLQAMQVEDLPPPTAAAPVVTAEVVAPKVQQSEEMLAVSDFSAKTAQEHAVARVRKGDTLYSFARRNGIPAAKVAEINGLNPPYDISGYNSLKIGRGAPMLARAEKKDKLSSVRPVFRPERAQLTKLDTKGAPVPRFRPETLPVSAVVPEMEDFKPFNVRPKLSKKSGFIWPVAGKVISRFGPKSGGLYNDGVNIAAPMGSPIHAAMEGKVVYVGDDLENYGNLLILRHKNGWLTAYAHTSAIKVKKGQNVKRGQVVAEVGQSGNVQTPQLHFGIRDGKRPLDPLRKISG